MGHTWVTEDAYSDVGLEYIYDALLSNGILPEKGIRYGISTNNGFNKALRENPSQEAKHINNFKILSYK